MRAALILLLCWPLAAGAADPPDPKALASYGFDAALPLPRLRTIPPWLLKLWADADGEPYEAYAPAARETEIVRGAVAALPEPMRRTLSERLIGIYLVKNLKGNGLTQWVPDASGKPHVYMILNSAGFRQTLSELMTERDLTAFRGPADLKVDAGDRPGILYSIAHEAAHAFDYVHSVTPYTDAGVYDASPPGAKTDKKWDVWAGYSEPKAAADYPLRVKLRFYGFGEPELEPAQAAELCSQWAASPFASFYGSRSWAEDFAELFVLRHLTQDLGLPLIRTCAGRRVEPWALPVVRGRAQRLLKPLYQKK